MPKKYTKAIGIFWHECWVFSSTWTQLTDGDWFETRRVLLSWRFGTFQFLHLQTAHLIADVDQRRIVQILTGLIHRKPYTSKHLLRRYSDPPQTVPKIAPQRVFGCLGKVGTGTLSRKQRLNPAFWRLNSSSLFSSEAWLWQEEYWEQTCFRSTETSWE